MKVKRFRPTTSSIALGLSGLMFLGFSAACSSSSDGGGGTSTGGNTSTGGSSANGGTPAGGSTASGACPLEKRVGGFLVQITPESAASAASAQFNGAVNDSVDPRDLWITLQKEGDCRVIGAPTLTCAPACVGGTVCSGNNNACVAVPKPIDVGTVNVKGLKTEINTSVKGSAYYESISEYPPANPGDPITLTVPGKNGVPGFTLHGVGIDPVTTSVDTFAMETGKPLNVTWNPPSKASNANIQLSLDIGHHGGVNAKLVCDVPDTGSYAVPASLLAKLVEQGVAGFPLVYIYRRSVDSTAVNGNCVEFLIASGRADGHPLTIPGVISCNPCEDSGGTCENTCPSGKTCQSDRTCK